MMHWFWKEEDYPHLGQAWGPGEESGLGTEQQVMRSRDCLEFKTEMVSLPRERLAGVKNGNLQKEFQLSSGIFTSFYSNTESFPLICDKLCMLKIIC